MPKTLHDELSMDRADWTWRQRARARWFDLRLARWRAWHDQLPSIVASLLPRKVVYYASIRLGVHATTGQHSNQVVPDLTFLDALKRWQG